MPIGELARRAGLRPSAIRYYESIGLLPEPPRVAGQRRYPPQAQRTLSVIGAAQRAGLSLDEIRELLVASDGDRAVSVQLQTANAPRLRTVRFSTIRRAGRPSWPRNDRPSRVNGQARQPHH